MKPHNYFHIIILCTVFLLQIVSSVYTNYAKNYYTQKYQNYDKKTQELLAKKNNLSFPQTNIESIKKFSEQNNLKPINIIITNDE